MKDYYYILGIKPEATLQQVKSAHRKLSMKFHPDKNEGDKFFEERFKDIQEAYECLSDPMKRQRYDSTRIDYRYEYEELRRKEQEIRIRQEELRRQEEDLRRQADEASRRYETSKSTQTQTVAPPLTPASKSSGKSSLIWFVIILAVLALFASLSTVSEKPHDGASSGPQTITPPQSLLDPTESRLSKPLRASERLETPTEKPTPKSLAETEVEPLNDNPSIEISETYEPVETVRPKVLAGYFTVGSTKDEVLAAQGTPSEFNDYAWEFGYSKVQFQGDKVVSWYNSPANPLKVQMLPSNTTGTFGFYTVGSTKDEVLAAQGTPSAFSDYTWEYGYSKVQFQGGKVISWYNSPANPLKVRMIASTTTSSLTYFTIGSTKDEVLTVQGTPTEFSDFTWEYGYSKVQFQDGKVISWYNSPANPLRVRMIPTRSTSSLTYFTVGSTKDEVLTVQGTPTEFSDYTWEYGYSKVQFQDSKVISWYNSPANPLKVRMIASTTTSSLTYFTIGSTKDEVLTVQGTPTEFSDFTWEYGYSKVQFQDGKVISWYNSPANPLKARLGN